MFFHCFPLRFASPGWTRRSSRPGPGAPGSFLLWSTTPVGRFGSLVYRNGEEVYIEKGDAVDREEAPCCVLGVLGVSDSEW